MGNTPMIESTISTSTARRLYDRLGLVYDWAERFEGRAKERALVRLELAPGQRVLNVGVGTGHEQAQLQTSVAPSGLIVGLDISPVMRAIWKLVYGMKGTPMRTKLGDRFPVRGRLRALLRLPIWLYRLRLGWLLGERGLMLTHIGRKSGRFRQTVLEVGGYDRITDTYIVAAGWGARSDWVRNIEQRPDVMVDVGRRRFEARAWRLAAPEAEGWFRDFARRRPFEFRTLVRMATGQPPTGTGDDYHSLVSAIPVIALRPRSPSL